MVSDGLTPPRFCPHDALLLPHTMRHCHYHWCLGYWSTQSHHVQHTHSVLSQKDWLVQNQYQHTPQRGAPERANTAPVPITCRCGQNQQVGPAQPHTTPVPAGCTNSYLHHQSPANPQLAPASPPANHSPAQFRRGPRSVTHANLADPGPPAAAGLPHPHITAMRRTAYLHKANLNIIPPS